MAYMSQKLSSAQRKYQTTERECLAVLTAIEKFRPYIEGVHFSVITDHASLLWLQNLKDPSGRLGRWALRLQAYNFDLKHRKGKLMVVADALSRAVNVVDVRTFIQDDDDWFNKLKRGIEVSPEKFSQFRIEDGVVYKFCAKGSKSYGYRASWRIVVPKGKCSGVLEECHDVPRSVHGGYFKTADRVKRVYFWPRMDEDIKRYISG